MQPTLSTTRERRLANRRSSPIRVEKSLVATISKPPPPAASVTVHPHHYHGHGNGRRRHSHALRCARTRPACSSVRRAPAKAAVAVISAEIEMASGGDVEGGNGQVPRKAFGVIASTYAPALVTRGEGGDEAAEVRAVEPHNCGRRAPREAQLCRRRRTSAEQAATGHHRTNAAAGGPAWLQKAQAGTRRGMRARRARRAQLVLRAHKLVAARKRI